MANRKTPEQQLAELETQKKQLSARIQKTKAKVRTVERKQDTRRKIIAGALALEHAEIDPAFGEQLRRLINRHVDRAQDRELFNLPPKESSAPASNDHDGQSGEGFGKKAREWFRSSSSG